jgi:hypothetical protein
MPEPLPLANSFAGVIALDVLDANQQTIYPISAAISLF